MSERSKLAIYWAASCGGCEMAVLGIDERILELDRLFEIVFCPCLVDVKLAELEAMPPDAIDICLFNGAVRTSEQEQMARLLRNRSKVLVAFGSCAHEGCVPGLANTTTAEQILRTVYREGDTIDDPTVLVPQPAVTVEGCRLELPTLYDRVLTLAQVVQVDYTLPGCPPESGRVWEALESFTAGKLPPRGTVLGRETTVCDECPRTREEKRIKRFRRSFEFIPDEQTCLLEQGLICHGIATRAGCGALCPQVNSPCIGCYGPNTDVEDFGARMMSALASVIDSDDPEEIEQIIREGIPDPVGTFYRFSLAHSPLARRLDALSSSGSAADQGQGRGDDLLRSVQSEPPAKE
jgi:F420-non-reducing hydrogenase small subunit